MNRLGLNDLVEPINRNLEFQLQDPFLLYKNAQGEEQLFVILKMVFYEISDSFHFSASIYGIWFYDGDECARIGQLMNRYNASDVQICHAHAQSGSRGDRQPGAERCERAAAPSK